MSQRDENSVLFSLNHLKAMAVATASAGPIFSTAPIRRDPSIESFYVSPSAIAPSVLLASIGPSERPRWLVPAIAGVGSLLLIFLALLLVLVLSQPEPQVSVVKAAPALVAAPGAPSLTPPAESSKVASATTSAPLEGSGALDEGKAKEPKKLAKGTRGKRSKGRLARRGKRGKQPAMVAAAPAPSKAKKRPRRDALDDLLDQALNK